MSLFSLITCTVLILLLSQIKYALPKTVLEDVGTKISHVDSRDKTVQSQSAGVDTRTEYNCICKEPNENSQNLPIERQNQEKDWLSSEQSKETVAQVVITESNDQLNGLQNPILHHQISDSLTSVDIQNDDMNNNEKVEDLRHVRDLHDAVISRQELLRQAVSSLGEEMCTEKCAKCDPDKNKLKCYNESTVALCTSTGVEKLIKCTGRTPLCHPVLNVCTSRRLVSNIQSSLQFSCPSHNGYYPDMEDCRKFYFCLDGKSYPYNCGPSEVYNPLTRACALQSVTTPCRRFNCVGKNGRYEAYSGDPAVYALCLNNKVNEILHCPDGEAMDGRQQKCQTHCNKEGLIVDYTSCTHYYECTNRLPFGGLISNYKITRRECPPTTVFHPAVLHCVPQAQYNSCNTDATPENGQTDPSSTSSELPTTTNLPPMDMTTVQ